MPERLYITTVDAGCKTHTRLPTGRVPRLYWSLLRLLQGRLA
jgi:hypothetical protein